MPDGCYRFAYEAKVKKYADRKVNRILELKEFFNPDIKKEYNSDAIEKIIHFAREYCKSVRWLEEHKNDMDDDTFLELKNHYLTKYMNIANKNLEKETIMMLIRYAVKDKNSDVCTTILNFLYRNCKEEFMECFTKGGELKVKIEGKSV